MFWTHHQVTQNLVAPCSTPKILPGKSTLVLVYSCANLKSQQERGRSPRADRFHPPQLIMKEYCCDQQRAAPLSYLQPALGADVS